MSGGKVFVKRRGMTAIPNSTVWDERLSYMALGLLTVILASPQRKGGNGYRAYMGRGAGEMATLRVLKELSELGYRHQFRRSADGKFTTDTVVSEVPITAEEAEQWHSEQVAKSSKKSGTMPPKPRQGTTPQKPRHGEGPDHAEENHAWKPAASSVPEDQGSLSSYVTKEPEDSKKAEPVLVECHVCNTHRLAENVTDSGICIDCLPQPAAPRPATQHGVTYRDYLRARNEAKEAREPLPEDFHSWLASRPVPTAENQSNAMAGA
jgi:hypothetical protein